VACAKLQLNPCQGELVKAICARLTAANVSSFNAEAVANILHSLATLPAAAPSNEVLDALCKRFGALLKSRQAAELPNAQSTANTVWALSELNYAPADELAMSMVGRMVTLCRLPGQQPTAQAISNALLACAELGVPVKQADIDSLVSFLFTLNRHQIAQQDYGNTAWSLAVLGNLRPESLLDHLYAESFSQGELSQLEVSQLTPRLGQMYEASYSLQPPPSAPAYHHSAWSSLQGKLHRLRLRPLPDKPSVFGDTKLCTALKQLQLSFKSQVCIQKYWADAVLESRSIEAQAIILRLRRPSYIRNVPGR